MKRKKPRPRITRAQIERAKITRALHAVDDRMYVLQRKLERLHETQIAICRVLAPTINDLRSFVAQDLKECDRANITAVMNATDGWKQ